MAAASMATRFAREEENGEEDAGEMREERRPSGGGRDGVPVQGRGERSMGAGCCPYVAGHAACALWALWRG